MRTRHTPLELNNFFARIVAWYCRGLFYHSRPNPQLTGEYARVGGLVANHKTTEVVYDHSKFYFVGILDAYTNDRKTYSEDVALGFVTKYLDNKDLFKADPLSDEEPCYLNGVSPSQFSYNMLHPFVETDTCSHCSWIYPVERHNYCPRCGKGFSRTEYCRDFDFDFSYLNERRGSAVFRRLNKQWYEHLHQDVLGGKPQYKEVSFEKKGKTITKKELVPSTTRLVFNCVDGSLVFVQNKFGGFEPTSAVIWTAFHPILHIHDGMIFGYDAEYETRLEFVDLNIQTMQVYLRDGTLLYTLYCDASGHVADKFSFHPKIVFA